jgi:hypothetical protein
MRIWDIAPGYLSRQRLLGEHRELHGLVSILAHGKSGYARHPETLRWVGCVGGLIRRHDGLAAEMHLRGYVDRTPLTSPGMRVRWPRVFITPPGDQFALLALKYREGESGRVPLPSNGQELWAQHKYSVLARDPETYTLIGRRVARMRRGQGIGRLSQELVEILRVAPPARRLVNALEHMWGHVAGQATPEDRRRAGLSSMAMLDTIARLTVQNREPYLLQSTALSDLGACVCEQPEASRHAQAAGFYA